MNEKLPYQGQIITLGGWTKIGEKSGLVLVILDRRWTSRKRMHEGGGLARNDYSEGFDLGSAFREGFVHIVFCKLDDFADGYVSLQPGKLGLAEESIIVVNKVRGAFMPLCKRGCPLDCGHLCDTVRPSLIPVEPGLPGGLIGRNVRCGRVKSFVLTLPQPVHLREFWQQTDDYVSGQTFLCVSMT